MKIIAFLIGILVGITVVLMSPSPIREYASLRLRTTLGIAKDRMATEIYRASRKAEHRLEQEGYSRAGEIENPVPE